MARFGAPLPDLAEPLCGPWAKRVRARAEEAGVLVIAGMFTPAPDGRVRNTLLATELREWQAPCSDSRDGPRPTIVPTRGFNKDNVKH